MKNHIRTSRSLKYCLRALWGMSLLCVLFPLNASAETPLPCVVSSAECFDATDCDEDEICKVGVVFSQNSSCTMNFCTEKKKEVPCSMEPLECVTDSDCGPTELCSFENNNGCPVSSCSPAEEVLCPGFYLQCTEDSQCNADEECLIIPAADDCLLSLCVPAEEQLICPDVMPECYVDADCGFGGTCIEDTECGAHMCETTDMLCDGNEDCGDCMSCVYGVCQADQEVECTNDFYCDEGLECSPCGQCVPESIDLPECATTEDCGGCLNECLWGFCVKVEPECQGDYQCPAGDSCSECGTCEPDQKPECSEDADCGDCFGFCMEGQCFFTGALECETNWDCELNFICGECGQCEKDPAGSNVTLCIESGGKWDPMSCGHYECGNPFPCAAIDPGCDCGPNANFMGGIGCVEDANCAAQPECNQDADCGDCFGFCIDGQCQYTGALQCESDLDCGGSTPWCNECGQCEEDGYVRNPTIDLCHDTGGLWKPMSCGHYPCGEAPTCEAIIPGCDCGPGFNFTGDQGCEFDAACVEEECSGDTDCPGDCGICTGGTCSIAENCNGPGPNPTLCDENLDCNGEYCTGSCEEGICVDWVCSPDDKPLPSDGTPLVLGAGTIGGCSTQGDTQNTGFILFTLLSILALGRVRENN